MSLADDPDRERPPGADETALWCNHCMLPSGCRFPVEVADAVTGAVVGTSYVIVCVDCGGRLSPDGDVIG